MKHILEIKPAISPEHRHRIEKLLMNLGYEWHGGGTRMDKSSCDISFDSKGRDPDGKIDDIPSE